MAGTPAVNPIGDIIPPAPPPVGSKEAEVLQLRSMGLHFTAQLVENAFTPTGENVTSTSTITKDPKKDTHHA